VDRRPDQQPAGVGDDVAFAALDLLAGIPAARPARLGGLDRLAVDDPGRGAGLASRRLAGLEQQLEINPLQNPAVAPRVEIVLHGRERRKIARQLAPLAAGSGDVEDGVDDRPQIDRARPPQAALSRKPSRPAAIPHRSRRLHSPARHAHTSGE
jgi:hypothetical protein